MPVRTDNSIGGVERMFIPSSIEMFPAGSNVYLGLCSARTETHAFCLGETLFVFLWSGLNLAQIVQSVQDVVTGLPADTGWIPEPENALRLDWIAQELAAREEALISAPPRGRMEVRRRLLPA